MKTVKRIFLPLAIFLILLGIIAANLRPVAIPLGIGFLIVGYVFEKVLLGKKRYCLSNLSTRTEIESTLLGVNAEVLVSDKWDINKSKKLSRLVGDYKIRITEMFSGEFSMISRIVFERFADLPGKASSDAIRVDVDTGWLLFLVASETEFYSSAKLKFLIQGELKRLPSSKPLCLWLKSRSGQNVGVVVSSGEGDGEYTVKYVAKDGVLTKIQVTFIEHE